MVTAKRAKSYSDASTNLWWEKHKSAILMKICKRIKRRSSSGYDYMKYLLPFYTPESMERRLLDVLRDELESMGYGVSVLFYGALFISW